MQSFLVSLHLASMALHASPTLSEGPDAKTVVLRSKRPHVTSCRPLLEGELEIQEIAETLWKAPMAILSSNDGDSEGEPPVYRYANEVCPRGMLSLLGLHVPLIKTQHTINVGRMLP